MTGHFLRKANKKQKRAVVAVQVAVFSVVLVGMAALTIDVGAMYNAKADLQRTADAAALAAAAQLSEYTDGPPIDSATEVALQYVQNNPVLGQTVTLNVETDIVFGRADFIEGEYTFTPDSVMPDAVRVRVRKTIDSPNDSLSLYFGKVFGITNTELWAESVAVMMPRDIAVVADLSGSHNDDSELRQYKSTEVNVHEVWGAFPGGVGDIDSSWGPEEDLPADWIEEDGSIPQAAGPAWGYMRELGYGTLDWEPGGLHDPDYDPTADDGLIRLPYNQDWSDAELEAHLSDQGYSANEIDAIMSDSYDSDGAYQYRVAVALGLAFWNSGKSGGLWESRGVDPSDTGNGNSWIGSSELDWIEPVFSKSISTSKSIWLDYINNYVKSSSTTMYQANHSFRYRFGVKTFTNYLMDRRPSHSQTPELAESHTQPMQAVKDAVEFMVGFVDELDTDDQLSLEIYGRTAHHEVDLTQNYAEVSNRLNEMQAGHYDTWTNVGGGLERAIEELESDRARALSRKMIILLTDGVANTDEHGNWDEDGAVDYALAQAQIAADNGVRIFAVSVGVTADQSLMQQIAELGHGEHFHAEGSIAQYSAELADIFQRLGSRRPVELIR